MTHQSISNTHQTVPITHQTDPNTYQIIPNAHQTVPITHQIIPNAHQTVPITHQIIPNAHQTVPITHQTVPITHQTIPNTDSSVATPPLFNVTTSASGAATCATNARSHNGRTTSPTVSEFIPGTSTAGHATSTAGHATSTVGSQGRGDKWRGERERELRRYVQMLLSRSPGIPLSGEFRESASALGRAPAETRPPHQPPLPPPRPSSVGEAVCSPLVPSTCKPPPHGPTAAHPATPPLHCSAASLQVSGRRRPSSRAQSQRCCVAVAQSGEQGSGLEALEIQGRAGGAANFFPALYNAKQAR
uniref:Uncharacterized protein LOC116956819 n=1 Tax=Petromyzon marinus TaxID=7757 RepID=A0AAJ7UG11_PETMA|nr:uncharacterized protein LOC116956819 [Petromyzon marinus]